METVERKWSVQQEDIFAWFEKDQHHFIGGNYRFNEDEYEVYIDVEGHLVVRARAGTGKTTTIVEGVNRAPESSILVAAYNKKIAQELVLSVTNPNVTVKTLHAVGYAAVRRFRERIKCDFGNGRADSLTELVCGKTAPDAIKRLVSKLHTKGREILPHANKAGDLIEIAIKYECEPDESWANSGFPLERIEEFALQAMELASQIKSGETIDGSDMIFLPVRNHWLQKEFDMVVIDEAQDMTNSQLEIAQGVNRGRTCIVGDDRQAIYGFRGADSNSIDRLKAELKASELGLTVTYRCPQSVVRLAQEIVFDFECGPNNEEGAVYDLHTSQLATEAGPGDFILSRVNAPLVSIAMKLLRSGKRTKVAGKDIGKGLVTLIRKFKATSVPDFLRKVESWETKEVNRLKILLAAATSTNGRVSTIQGKIEEVQDKAEMLISLSEGSKNIDEITNRIESLFTDDGQGDKGLIVCSSVHRAKGLETDKVFVLKDTLRYHNIEEDNIRYVSFTRAKQTLVLVSDNVRM